MQKDNNKILFTKLDCQLVKDSYEKLNSQFAKVKIRIAYAGANRNGTRFSKELLQHMAEKSLKNVPIIGEWKEDNDNFGSHGGRLELDDDGFRFIDTTRPYGVVPTDTEISWETLRENDGYTEHEYICCTGILWVGRYSECEKILSDGANQSMEVLIHKAEYADDNILDIFDAEFSALCILGKSDILSENVEPCFEKAGLESYSLDSFKVEFNKMLSEYKQFSNDKENEKGACDMLDKIVSTLSTYVFKNDIGQELGKYILLSISDNDINVIDREDYYKAFTITYTVGEDDSLKFDFENKVEKSIAVGNKLEQDFSIQNEINAICAAKVEYTIKGNEAMISEQFDAKYQELEDKYFIIQKELEDAKGKLDEYEAEKTKMAEEIHRKSVDDVVVEFEKKLNNNADFLMYRAKLDYSKSPEQVRTDLTLIIGNAQMGKKAKFGYSPVTYGTNKTNESSSCHSRYGSLFDKVKK